MTDFEKNVCIQKITFWFFWLRENDIFCIFRVFLKSMNRIEKFITCQILNRKKYNASDFELQKYNASDFEFEEKQRVLFWI